MFSIGKIRIIALLNSFIYKLNSYPISCSYVQSSTTPLGPEVGGFTLVLTVCTNVSSELSASESLARRNMMFMLMVSYASPWSLLWIGFIYVLTCIYTFFFLHLSAALHYIQIYYIWSPLHMLDTISLFSLLTLKSVLSSSRFACL